MGRWAEVYFTNPPERRDEAVLELVRELEREQSQANAASSLAPRPAIPPGVVQTFSASTTRRQDMQLSFSASTTRRQDMQLCDSCGNENPVTHQFCGMCGAKVRRDPAEAASREDVEPQNHQSPYRGFGLVEAGRPELDQSDPDPSNQDRKLEDRSAEGFYAEPDADPEEQRPAPVFNTPAAGSDSLSLFQSFRSARAENEDWDYEPQSSSHSRFYIAAILLIVIGGLGYMAWRSSQSTPAYRGASPPPPAPVTEAPQPGPPSSQQAAPSPEQTAVSKNPQPAAAKTPKTENATAFNPRC